MVEGSFHLMPQMSARDAIALWSNSPDPAASVAVCNWIAGYGGAAPRVSGLGREIVVAVGRECARRHPRRVGVLIAIGRMYLVASELKLALEILVCAARLDPNEPVVRRLLGEVLFRTGDVVRAQRMLERAVAEGMTDPETLHWLNRARLCTGSIAAPSAPGSIPPQSNVRTRSGVRLAAAAHWSQSGKPRAGNE